MAVQGQNCYRWAKAHRSVAAVRLAGGDRHPIAKHFTGGLAVLFCGAVHDSSMLSCADIVGGSRDLIPQSSDCGSASEVQFSSGSITHGMSASVRFFADKRQECAGVPTKRTHQHLNASKTDTERELRGVNLLLYQHQNIVNRGELGLLLL